MRAARSVVQFGRGIYDGYESVVRFFATIEDYHATMEVYLNSPLTDMLPKLIAYCDNFEGAGHVSHAGASCRSPCRYQPAMCSGVVSGHVQPGVLTGDSSSCGVWCRGADCEPSWRWRGKRGREGGCT